MEKKEFKLYQNNFFWINFFITVVVFLFLQLFVHFGFKFGLLPQSVEYIYLQFNQGDGPSGYDVYWKIPSFVEVMLQILLFIIISHFTAAVFSKFIKYKNQKYKVLTFLNITLKNLLLIITMIVLTNQNISKDIFFIIYKNGNKENYVIDCNNHTIKFLFHNVKRKSEYCHYCRRDTPEELCIFKGLDVFEPSATKKSIMQQN